MEGIIGYAGGFSNLWYLPRLSRLGNQTSEAGADQEGSVAQATVRFGVDTPDCHSARRSSQPRSSGVNVPDFTRTDARRGGDVRAIPLKFLHRRLRAGSLSAQQSSGTAAWYGENARRIDSTRSSRPRAAAGLRASRVRCGAPRPSRSRPGRGFRPSVWANCSASTSPRPCVLHGKCAARSVQGQTNDRIVPGRLAVQRRLR